MAVNLSKRFVDGSCRNCTTSPPKPAPPPGPAGLTLTRSVGAGGVNIRTDVQAVQSRLNMVPVSQGGPAQPLISDGLVGPKTIAAIRRYQQAHVGFQDGRIDPNGPTLKALNSQANGGSGSSPLISFGIASNGIGDDHDDLMMKLLREHIRQMPHARAAIFSARRRLTNVERFVSDRRIERPTDIGLDRERHNLDLLDDTLGIMHLDRPLGTFQMIKVAFELMSRAAQRCRTEVDPLENGLFAINPIPAMDLFPNAIAYVARHGFHLLPEEVEDAEHPGCPVKTDRIYITALSRAFIVDQKVVISTIIHELAHWVSWPGDEVRDVVPGFVATNEQRFRDLPAEDKAFSAENYAWFGIRSLREPFAF